MRATIRRVVDGESMTRNIMQRCFIRTTSLYSRLIEQLVEGAYALGAKRERCNVFIDTYTTFLRDVQSQLKRSNAIDTLFNELQKYEVIYICIHNVLRDDKPVFSIWYETRNEYQENSIDTLFGDDFTIAEYMHFEKIVDVDVPNIMTELEINEDSYDFEIGESLVKTVESSHKTTSIFIEQVKEMTHLFNEQEAYTLECKNNDFLHAVNLNLSHITKSITNWKSTHEECRIGVIAFKLLIGSGVKEHKLLFEL